MEKEKNETSAEEEAKNETAIQVGDVLTSLRMECS
jgi:hypothetical protein